MVAVYSQANEARQLSHRPSLRERQDCEKFDGFFPLYWDEHTGKMWLEIDRFNQEFLYVTALSAGVGSNDLGLDRGKMNEPLVVQFERSGPRILLIQSNYRFRASSDDPAERRSVRDSFARSTLWGFDVAVGRRLKGAGGCDCILPS